MTSKEVHEFISVPIYDLVEGQITWKEYINSLSPEDLAKQRAYDRNKFKKWYERIRNKRMNTAKKWSKQRVNCDCGKEISRGYLSKHLKSSST
jgi:hypothetical protein